MLGIEGKLHSFLALVLVTGKLALDINRFTPGEIFLFRTEHEAGCVPEPVWALQGKEKYLASAVTLSLSGPAI
jgi:hypothetical protein